jgi:hypothetical protein
MVKSVYLGILEPEYFWPLLSILVEAAGADDAGQVETAVALHVKSRVAQDLNLWSCNNNNG